MPGQEPIPGQIGGEVPQPTSQPKPPAQVPSEPVIEEPAYPDPRKGLEDLAATTSGSDPSADTVSPSSGDGLGEEARIEEAILGTPAAGMDEDPRYSLLTRELEEEWLRNHPGLDFLSFEGQNYRLGYEDAKPGDKRLTLRTAVDRLFRERYPEDAAAYDQKERSRIYEDPQADPAVRECTDRILSLTNLDTQVNKSGGGDSDTWARVNDRNDMNAWDGFVTLYPEKAIAYAEMGHPGIQRALRIQEARLQREIEQQSKPEEPVAPSSPFRAEIPTMTAEDIRSDPDAVFHIDYTREQAAAGGDLSEEDSAKLSQLERVARSVDTKTAKDISGLAAEITSDMPTIQSGSSSESLSEAEKIQQETDGQIAIMTRDSRVDSLFIQAYYSRNYDIFFRDKLTEIQTQWEEVTAKLATDPADPEAIMRKYDLLGQVTTLQGALGKMQKVIDRAEAESRVVAIQDFRSEIGLEPMKTDDDIQPGQDGQADQKISTASTSQEAAKVAQQENIQRDTRDLEGRTKEKMLLDERRRNIIVGIYAHMIYITDEKQKAALARLLHRVQEAEDDTLQQAFDLTTITSTTQPTE